MTAIFSFFLFYSFYSRFSSNTIHDRAKKLSYFFLLDFFLHTFSYYIFLSLSTRVTMKIKFQVCTELIEWGALKNPEELEVLTTNDKFKRKFQIKTQNFIEYVRFSWFFQMIEFSLPLNSSASLPQAVLFIPRSSKYFVTRD